jgi:diguanylate cyclase (GGDEF)-like protein/PAS domain S-box-containing protein
MAENEIGSFLEFLADAILIVDKESNIVFSNSACERLFGYEKSQFLTLKLTALMGDITVTNHHHKVAHFIDSQAAAKPMMTRSVIPCKGVSGRVFHARISISNILFDHKNCAIATIQDYTQIKNEFEELHSEANTDALTGLFNKRYLYSLIDSGHYFKDPYSDYLYAYIDLNGFKLVNDTLGHDIGDLLLSNLATKLTYHVRNEDKVLRMGGDEFLLIFKVSKTEHLYSTKCSLVTKIQNDIKACFEALGVKTTTPYMAGIGLVVESRNQDVLTIIKRADTAMYKSKANKTLFEEG